MSKQNQFSSLYLRGSQVRDPRFQPWLSFRFLEAAVQLKDLIEKASGQQLAEIDERLPHFHKLKLDEKIRVLFNVEATLRCGCRLLDDNISPLNSGSLAWSTLRHLGFVPRSDAFEHYVDGDFVEAYNAQNQLVFASLNFFMITSYSIEELYCRPWMELYSRDTEYTQLIVEKVIEVLSGSETVEVHIPAHRVIETVSKERKAAMATCRAVSPLVDHAGEKGFIAVSRYNSVD